MPLIPNIKRQQMASLYGSDRSCVAVVLVMAVCVLAVFAWATFIRYQWVEPAGAQAYCAVHAAQLTCLMREAAIFMLIEQRAGWWGLWSGLAAMVCTRVGFIPRWCIWCCAGLAMCSATAGLVLYSADIAASAWLVGGLALIGLWPGTAMPGQASNIHIKASKAA